MEITTFSEKTYSFFLEVNENNYKNICSSIPYVLKYSGYNWKELESSNYCSNSSNYPISSNTDTSETISFPTKENTFYIPSEITGKDTPSLICSSPGTAVFVENTLSKDQYGNPICSSESDTSEGCFTQTLPYSQSVSCSGEDECKTFFPPAKLTYMKENFTTPSVIFNGNINNISSTTPTSSTFPTCNDGIPICASGKPTFNYNLYKPLNYSNIPTLNSDNTYIAPSTPIQAGFYNVFPLLATISLLSNLNSPPSTTYAVYEIIYEINDFNLIENNQLLDFLNLQSYLQSTFSSWFQTNYQNENLQSMKQLLIDYCNETSSMSDSVCNSLNISSLFNKSPCINPYSNCIDGWNSFCSKEENYNSSICLDYYKNSYNGNILDNSIQNNLKSICSEMYESNPSILSSEDYLNTCACFLPEEVYKNFPNEITSESPENWYYPCYRSLIKENKSPSSPTTEIVSCMNQKYKKSTSTEDITNQIYNECYNEEQTTFDEDNILKKDNILKNNNIINPITIESKNVNPIENTTSPPKSEISIGILLLIIFLTIGGVIILVVVGLKMYKNKK